MTTANAIHSVEILTVGTEILMGQIVNTNAAWIARELRDMGFPSYYQSSCGDNPKRLREAIRLASERSDLLIMTGGLGPTQDDISMAAAAAFMGQELVFRPEEYAKIEAYFHRTGRQASANNRKQAELPRGARIMPNSNGTAPGAILEGRMDGKAFTIALLPGPPGELQPMFRASLRPYLESRRSFRLRTLNVHLIGIGESDAEWRIRDLMARENPTLAPYASTGQVMLRITQRFQSEAEEDQTQALLGELRTRLGDFIYEVGDRTMPALISDLLRERGETLTLAESCTGGLLASQLTALPGASAVFPGSIVSYSNQVKERLLGVTRAVLEMEGAVSESCVCAMAQGARTLFHTDYALAVSGIAGPDGATPEKPVGSVFIALADAEHVRSHGFLFNGNRRKVQELSALNALNLLRLRILERARQT